MFYVSYDQHGNITAAESTDEEYDFPRMLKFDQPIDIVGKRVNLETLELEAITND